MNTMVRMTPITSQTMMVRMVLFTYAFPSEWTMATKTAPRRQIRPSRGNSTLPGGNLRLEAARQEVLLGAFVAGGIGLAYDDLLECPTQGLEIVIIPRSLENFDEEGAVGFQVQLRE